MGGVAIRSGTMTVKRTRIVSTDKRRRQDIRERLYG
jgi:hypothetical protein